MKLSASAARVASYGALAALLASVSGAAAQTRCLPMAERTGEIGCWITASTPVGKMRDGQAIWYIDSYASRAEAEAAKGPSSTVVESLGKIWLFTIGSAGWRSSSGV